MALQGDLGSFALPDVLQLLAATGKSGRLDVRGATGTGEVWFLDGGVVSGSVSTAPNSTDPAEVVYELLRFEDGAFEFLDQLTPAGGDRLAVDAVLEDAGTMLDRWSAVTQVVPGLDVWVSLRPELDGGEVTLTSDQWRTLVGLRGGVSVRELGDRLAVSDLTVSEAVKDLVEHGVAEIGAELPAPVAEPAEPTDYFGAPDDHPTAREQLDAMAATYIDAPVVIESTEDALLPEPLPDFGSSYEYDGSYGEVDGFDAPHSDEAVHHEPAAHEALADLPAWALEDDAPAPATDGWGDAPAEDPWHQAADPVAPTWDDDPWGAPAPEATVDPMGATADPAAEPTPHLAAAPEPAQAADTDPYGGLANLSPEAAQAIAATADESEAAPVAGDGEDPVDRSSLLRFLSTVKN